MYYVFVRFFNVYIFGYYYNHLFDMEGCGLTLINMLVYT